MKVLFIVAISYITCALPIWSAESREKDNALAFSNQFAPITLIDLGENSKEAHLTITAKCNGQSIVLETESEYFVSNDSEPKYVIALLKTSLDKSILRSREINHIQFSSKENFPCTVACLTGEFTVSPSETITDGNQPLSPTFSLVGAQSCPNCLKPDGEILLNANLQNLTPRLENQYDAPFLHIKRDTTQDTVNSIIIEYFLKIPSGPELKLQAENPRSYMSQESNIIFFWHDLYQSIIDSKSMQETIERHRYYPTNFSITKIIGVYNNAQRRVLYSIK